MKKIILIMLFFAAALFSPAFAEKIPIKLTPVNEISTHHDEIEIADWIAFKIVKDVYVNDKLYIKEGTPIYGFVDFFHANGWTGDSAEIDFNKFKTRDVKGKEVTINYPLKIIGNNLKANDLKQSLALNLSTFVAEVFILLRGSEIYIAPEERTFNIFLTL